MKKPFFLIFFLTFFAYSTIAQIVGITPQNSNDTVRYIDISDDPYDLPKLHLTISPLLTNFSSNSNLNIGVFADYNISKKIAVRGYAEIQYPKISMLNLRSDNSSTVFREFPDKTIFQPVNENFFDIGFDYSFSERTRKELVPVTITASRSSSRNITIVMSNYIPVEASQRLSKQIRVGAFVKKSNFCLSQGKYFYTNDNVKFFSESTYGSLFIKYPDINYGDLEYNLSYDYSRYPSGLITKSSVFGGYIGISSQKIIKRVIMLKDESLRAYVKHSIWYADLLVGYPILSSFVFYKSNPSAIEYEDEISNTTKSYNIRMEKSNISMIPVGFRAGIKRHIPMLTKILPYETRHKALEKPYYFTSLYEIGSTPGFSLMQGLYFKIGLNIELNPF